jgi:hypothetical protein
MMTQFRTNWRLLDMEKTKIIIGKDKWNQVFIGHIVASILNTILIHHNFNFSKWGKIGVNVLNSGLIFSFAFFGSLDSYDEFDKKMVGKYIGSTLGGVMLFQIFFYLYNDLYSEYFDELSKKV